VFEKVPGSDIWWIRFKVDGVEHREKVGRRGDAVNLYKIRKADILRGAKMPTNMRHKGVKFSVLAQEAIDWYINHERRDVRNFKGRMKLILEAFGDVQNVRYVRLCCHLPWRSNLRRYPDDERSVSGRNSGSVRCSLRRWHSRMGRRLD
jgi:hypothetical protein